MTFTYPWVLLFLAIPALLLWALFLRPAGVTIPIDHHSRVERPWRRRLLSAYLLVADALPALILASAIVLLAGPQVLRQPKATRELTNILFAMDVSGSMMAEDRYGMAKEAIEEFTKAREGDAFGLTLFGSEQIRWIPLTTDLEALRNALPFANPARQPRHMGGTRIGAALRFCRDSMINEAQEGDRLIVLVSDGMSSDLGDGFAEGDIAQELADEKITVYHVHVGSDQMPQEVVDIANQTGGQAFAAKDKAALKGAFRYIDRMRPATFKPSGTVPMDYFTPIAAVLLGFLGLHAIGLLVARYTPW
jgi:Ca-activated chloride channel family protein